MLPRIAGQIPTSARASVDLPEPLGPNHAERIACLQREAQILNQRVFVARRGDGDILHIDALARARQNHVGIRSEPVAEHLAEAPIGLAAGDEMPPLADRGLDRRESACRQYGSRNHHAGRDRLHDGEPGAEREHGRLQAEAEDLRPPGGKNCRSCSPTRA